MTDYICNNRSILNYTIGSGIGEWVLDNKTLLDHFNISGERIFTTNGTLVDYDDNRGQEVLKAVQEGYGVILHVEGHYVVVGQNSSCKQNEVYLYDPAPLNESKLGCATIEEAVRKASNRDSSVHKNAKWKGAYKYTAK